MLPSHVTLSKCGLIGSPIGLQHRLYKILCNLASFTHVVIKLI
jgi:hypothetical protein